MFQRIRNFFKRNDYDEFEYDYYEEGDAEFFSDRVRPKDSLRVSSTDDDRDFDLDLETYTNMDLPTPRSGNVSIGDVASRKKYVEESINQIIAAKKQIQETTMEYESVTNYITDIEKIERAEGDNRKKILELAKKIVKLNGEKDNFKSKGGYGITQVMYSLIEPYEEVMPDEIRKLEAYENEAAILREDMTKLEGERGNLRYERKNLKTNQSFIKMLIMVVLVVVILLWIMLVTMGNTTGKDMTIPFALTGILAGVCAVYVTMENRKIHLGYKMNSLKMNKLITLINSVKIKIFNNRNTVEYLRNKYGVNNHIELRYQWEQYMIAKENRRRFIENCEMLDLYEKDLLRQLDLIGVLDTNVWLSQTEAIIDINKMEKIKYRLTVRRSRLMNKIDYNNKLVELAMSDIKKLYDRDKRYKKEILEVLQRYDIEPFS